MSDARQRPRQTHAEPVSSALRHTGDHIAGEQGSDRDRDTGGGGQGQKSVKLRRRTTAVLQAPETTGTTSQSKRMKVAESIPVHPLSMSIEPGMSDDGGQVEEEPAEAQSTKEDPETAKADHKAEGRTIKMKYSTIPAFSSSVFSSCPGSTHRLSVSVCVG